MVSINESVLNLVTLNMPKMLIGMNVDGPQSKYYCGGNSKSTGEKLAPNLSMSLTRNTVNPYICHYWQADREERC